MSSAAQLPDHLLTATRTLIAIRDWINDVNKSEEVQVEVNSDQLSFLGSVKDGVALCKLVAKLKGRYVMFNKNPRGIDFMEQENISTFLQVCIHLDENLFTIHLCDRLIGSCKW